MARALLLLDFPERLQGWQRLLPYALLLSVTFALYSTSLYFYFVWDDRFYILEYEAVQTLDWEHLKWIWTTTHLGHYAPVTISTFAVLFHFFGTEAFGFHLGQLLLHTACVCLVYLLLKKLESGRIALLATLLFAVHPTNIETVAWISEAKSTLAFLFFLLSFWFFIRMRERERWSDGILSGIFLIASLLAKVSTVVAPAIFLLYDYKRGATLRTLRWRSLLPFFAISGAMTFIHLGAFHESARAMETEYYGGPLLHLMNIPLVLAFYLQMIVFPHPLSAWQMFPAQQHFNSIVALGWLGLFLAAALILVRTQRDIQFWVAWFFVFLLPVSGLVPFGIWIADRYLYVPGIGAFVLIGMLFFAAADKAQLTLRRRALESAAVMVILLLAWRTVDHLPAWKHDVTLWAATVPTCPQSAYCRANFGAALAANGQVEEGVQEFIRAVELRPDPSYFERLGDVLTFGPRDYDQAVFAFETGLERGGSDRLYGKLARTYYLAGDYQKALAAVERGKAATSDDLGIWVIEALISWKQGDWQAARESLAKAKTLIKNSPKPDAVFEAFLADRSEVPRMLSDLKQ
jgi:tetratricopeptide (TPR) repeat protein